MFGFHLRFVLIYLGVVCLKIAMSGNVFDDVPACTFHVNKTRLSLRSPVVQIRKFGMQVLLSPCSPITPTAGCDPSGLVCVLKSGAPMMPNAGKRFVAIETEDKENPGQTQVMLKSVSGDRCTGDRSKNYTTYVTFGKNYRPDLYDFNECEIFVRILDPRHQTSCTKRVDGYLLDFRKLAGDIRIRSKNNKTFIVSLCGPAKGCGGTNVAACEVLSDNSKYAIGTTDTQNIAYRSNAHVEINYRLGMGRGRLDTKISLKCNWNVLKGNAQYIVPHTQGKKYQFIVESHLACIKIPMSCQVQDSDNYQYNLQELYKSSGFWDVSGVPNGSMVINFCGPLISESATCSANFSQICHTDVKGESTNYGSILTNFEVRDDIVKGSLTDGSVCPRNKTFSLQTNIDFKCGLSEKGPSLHSFTNCSANILWETPKACPAYITSGKNCFVNDLLGNRNLAGLRGDRDRVHHLNQRTYLRYSLCGNLTENCKNTANVSICLHVDNQQYIQGVGNDNLISNNGILSLNFLGEKCKTPGLQRSVRVTFVCNFAAPIAGFVTVNVVQDMCSYNMTITSPLACASPSVASAVDCTVRHESSLYNLTSLTRSDKNYVIPGQDENLEYHINVCGPTLTTDRAMCLRNTGVCLRNKLEPNLRNRFTSVGAGQKLSVENNELVLRYSFGRFCGKFGDASTVIHFKCSKDVGQPTFLKETNCVHEFNWSIPQACPNRIQIPRSVSECILKDNLGKILNLTSVKKRTLKLTINKENVQYIVVNLCSDNYTKVSQQNTTTVAGYDRRLLNRDGDLYIDYNLDNGTCLENQGVHSLKMYLVCDPVQENEHFVINKDVEDCTVSMTFNTHVICDAKEYQIGQIRTGDKLLSNTPRSDTLPNENTRTNAELAKSKIPHKNSAIAESPSPRDQQLKNVLQEITNCSITHGDLSLNLNNIRPISILSPSSLKYTVGINRSSADCIEYICKEQKQIATLKTCPKARISDDLLKVNFSGDAGRSAEIWFKCNSSLEFPSVLKETERAVVLLYPTSEVCALKSTEGAASAAAIAAIVAAVLIFLVLVFGVVYANRKYGFCKNYERIIPRGRKSDVNVYCRDLNA